MKHVEEKEENVLKPSSQGVIITIGREHGSSGKQIGKLVAEKLSIPFYYKEMTALAAQERVVSTKNLFLKSMPILPQCFIAFI